jgi:hypothetical protein
MPLSRLSFSEPGSISLYRQRSPGFGAQEPPGSSKSLGASLFYLPVYDVPGEGVIRIKDQSLQVRGVGMRVGEVDQIQHRPLVRQAALNLAVDLATYLRIGFGLRS